MGNKTKITYSKYSLLLGIGLSVSALADCNIEELIEQQSTAIVEAKRNIEVNVSRLGSGNKICLVEFEAKIDGEWHSAYGDHEWSGHMPDSQMCDIADQKATKNIVKSLGSIFSSEETVVCNEASESKLKNIKVGTTGTLDQFRPDGSRPGYFYYNGTQCFWFKDVEWKSNDISNFKGIACEMGGNGSIHSKSTVVVVDKF